MIDTMFTPLLICALGLQWIIIAVWLWQHILMNRIEKEHLRLTLNPNAFKEPVPSVTVIVPARNEQRHIESCIRAIGRQTNVRLNITVVDDRSTDATRAVIQRAVCDIEHTTVLHIDTLPEGWLGKSHALWAGAQHAESEWLLFIDADVQLFPGAIASALAYALAHNLDFLSLWPRDGSQGFWEHVLIPLCGAQIVIWYGSSRVNRRDSTPAFANGQFILVRRAEYLRIGGHAAVRRAIIEDIPLAEHAKQNGLAVRSALGSELYQVRMYETLVQIVAGWTRIFRGVLSPAQMICCVMWLLVGSALPFVVLPVVGLSLSAAHSWKNAVVLTSLVHVVILASVSIRFFSLSHCRLRYLLLYPLSVCGVFVILIRALVQRWRSAGVSWKGTCYNVKQTTIAAPTGATESTPLTVSGTIQNETPNDA